MKTILVMKTILATTIVALGLLSVALPAVAAAGYEPNRTDDSRRPLSDRVFSPIGGLGGGE